MMILVDLFRRVDVAEVYATGSGEPPVAPMTHGKR